VVFSIRSEYARHKRQTWKQGVSSPCGGGVEYFHRDPASRRRRQVPSGIIVICVITVGSAVQIKRSRLSSVYFNYLSRIPRDKLAFQKKRPCNTVQYVRNDGQSASLSWCQAPILFPRPDFCYCQTVARLLMWSALSDERTGLSFTIAASPRQRSHSRVRVPRDS
jgi:hypothetical protein